MFKSAGELLLALALLGASIIIHVVHGYVPVVANARSSYGGDSDSELIESASKEQMPSLQDTIDLSFYRRALNGSPDRKSTAALVGNYSLESSRVNPEELGSYLEGDILFPASYVDARARNAVTTQSSRWPSGVVPFEINGDFNAMAMDTIEKAISAYHEHTCIRFVPHTKEPDYVSIESDNSGCWSPVGRIGGKQVVNLQSPSCLGTVGTPIHELMHALGFGHEQSRGDRDYFVEIVYDNIKREDWANFDKANKTIPIGAYDYGSVMHYSDHAFSTNGKPTIVAIQPDLVVQMGQRKGFSVFDVEKLNNFYCGDVSPAAFPSESEVPDNLIASFLGGFINGLVNDRKDKAIKA